MKTIKLKDLLIEKNTKFKIGDKFTDINSNKPKEEFTVLKVDGNGVYDKKGWYRLNKNCKSVLKEEKHLHKVKQAINKL